MTTLTTRWRAQLALVTGKAIVFTTLSAFFAHAAVAVVPGIPVLAQPRPEPSVQPSGTPFVEKDEMEIPKNPTAPPSLLQAIPTDPFHCHRLILYQGKPIDCDSNVRRDGDKLRRIIKDVPAAVSELDTYQSNRRDLKYTAYAASAGLLVTLIGYFGTRGTNGFRNSDSSLTPLAMVALSGLTFSVGSMIFGFVRYERNESHLTEAINQYNLATPTNPIELEFKTGIHF